MMATETLENVVNLLNEIGMLAHIPRSGFAFLGSGKQSVAEHSFRVALIAHALAKLSTEKIDTYRLMMLCLYHDLPEARVGDMNYVQKRYVQVNLDDALKDLGKDSLLGPEIIEWIREYETGETLEAQLAHDADQLELLLVLKREDELGNNKALDWFEKGFERIKTDTGRRLAEAIAQTSSDLWWNKIYST